ncbi:hypothetical protein OGAPHI_006415 [Ogataea philodendri]|uniref:Cell division control protein 14 n=1 Tax=Ogataea philodendri TaxID=1378263 RepID=A0A9P8NY25_9ASCO|nr:uncharacterized protein OGAPHI_006415 [Ogataea philodendri]KAH3661567.1 hypothetical protein OGAPHI_006415 [Ogataea philodendri]
MENVLEGIQQLDLLLGKLSVLKYETLENSQQMNSTYTSDKSAESRSQETGHSTLNLKTRNLQRRWKVPKTDDLIFGEFLALQNDIHLNVVANLIHNISNIAHQKDYELLKICLKVIQGCLLLHPPSRNLFILDSNMLVLLRLLDLHNPPQVIESVIPTLVSILVRNVPNIRTFENLDGTKAMCTLLTHKISTTSSSTGWKEVQVKALEFLFFYLIPESHSGRAVSGVYDTSSTHSRSGPNKFNDDGYPRRGTGEKAQILNRYLNKEITEGLIAELLSSKPFGNMQTDW